MPRSVAFGDRLRYFQGNMTDTVLLSIDGPRATITLNDPAKHNRLDPAGLSLLRQAIEKADTTPGVRVTVITGEDMISVTFTSPTLTRPGNSRYVRVTLCRWAVRL